MKLEYQKAIVSIPLSEYAEAYKEAGDPHLHVWVNVPRAMLQQRDDLDQEYMRLMAEVDIARAEFHQQLKKLDEQKENRKPEAIEKERKRLVKDFDQKQDALQAKIEDYTTRNYEWFAELWSQGPKDTHWPLEDIRELAENDHMLMGWMADRTRELLKTRRVNQKKS